MAYAVVAAIALLALSLRGLAGALIVRSVARMALAAQPDTITLVPQVSPRWEDESCRQALADQMREGGFTLAGWFTVTELPEVKVALFAHETNAIHAASYEHPVVGRWSECVSFYDDGTSFVCVGHTPFGSGARPGVSVHYHPALDASAIWRRLLEDRPTAGLVPADADESAARFREFYALDMAHRKQRGVHDHESQVEGSRRAA